MTQRSKFKGHKIEYDNENNQWVFSDTKESTELTHQNRPCGYCNQHVIKDRHEEYDSCIGRLPGLMNACCGHGNASEAYVQFMDGFGVHGEDAKIIQEVLIKWRDKERSK